MRTYILDYKKNKKGEWYWVVIAPNGKELNGSEPQYFKTKYGAKRNFNRLRQVINFVKEK